MRRWKSGTIGAVKMGTYHGLYCLGCCWPYFLLMVALGWMNLLWMGLFAGIIFGEKNHNMMASNMDMIKKGTTTATMQNMKGM
jgi:predicted metal-binding membrane protein